MKKPLILCYFLLLALAGCYTPRERSVAVREGLLRSEIAVTNRIALPLTTRDRDFLLSFLKSGLNPALQSDGVITVPDAEKKYLPLLSLLEKPLFVSNLVATTRSGKFLATEAFRSSFPSSGIREVIDAREADQYDIQPFAFADMEGRYWWIFYHRQGAVNHLLVMKAHQPRRER